MPEIRDITEPTEFIPEPSTPWWIWALAIAGGLLLVATIYFIVRKNKPLRIRRTLLDKARAKLSALREQSSTLPPETLATRTSIIIRHYLEAAFEDPALFETNEEFSLRPTALEALHPDTRQQITDHLHRLSQLKYAPNQDPDAASGRAATLIDEAGDLLAHIELHP